MTTSLADAYEGEFLKSEHLPEGTLVPVIIAEVVQPNTERDSQKRLIHLAILKFSGKEKGLILNKVNFGVLKAMLGASDTWVGKQINLQRRYLPAKKTVNQQDDQPCIRVIPPVGTPIPKNSFDFLGTKLPLKTNKEKQCE